MFLLFFWCYFLFVMYEVSWFHLFCQFTAATVQLPCSIIVGEDKIKSQVLKQTQQ